MAKTLAQDSGTRDRKNLWPVVLLWVAVGLAVLYFRYPTAFDLASEFPTPSKQPVVVKPVAKAAVNTVTPPSFDVAYAQPTGELVTAGRAQPNWIIKLHSNGKIIGQTKADENGEWVFTPEKPLVPGEHALSVMETDPENKQDITGSRPIVLSIAPKQVKPSDVTQRDASVSQTATKEASQTNPAAKNCDVAVVQGGDTLWGMADRCYGTGARYSEIYKSNQKQIRDPNLIYPDQRIVLPH